MRSQKRNISNSHQECPEKRHSTKSPPCASGTECKFDLSSHDQAYWSSSCPDFCRADRNPLHDTAHQRSGKCSLQPTIDFRDAADPVPLWNFRRGRLHFSEELSVGRFADNSPAW